MQRWEIEEGGDKLKCRACGLPGLISHWEFSFGKGGRDSGNTKELRNRSYVHRIMSTTEVPPSVSNHPKTAPLPE
jgi:hypothetical protein